MNPDDAHALLRSLVDAWLRRGLWLERDDFGDAVLFARRDLAHLDADALSDRLQAWTRRTVERRLWGADAFVSFRHARPLDEADASSAHGRADGASSAATRDEATLDLQERWMDLEPTFRLDLHRPSVTEADVRAFAAFVPEFVALVDAAGRPAGWRSVDEGNTE